MDQLDLFSRIQFAFGGAEDVVVVLMLRRVILFAGARRFVDALGDFVRFRMDLLRSFCNGNETKTLGQLRAFRTSLELLGNS